MRREGEERREERGVERRGEANVPRAFNTLDISITYFSHIFQSHIPATSHVPCDTHVTYFSHVPFASVIPFRSR